MAEIPSIAFQNPELLGLALDAVESKFGWLITIVKAIGVLVILYLLYLMVNVFSQFRNRKRVQRIEERLIIVEEKIDKLIRFIQKDKKKKRN